MTTCGTSHWTSPAVPRKVDRPARETLTMRHVQIIVEWQSPINDLVNETISILISASRRVDGLHCC